MIRNFFKTITIIVILFTIASFNQIVIAADSIDDMTQDADNFISIGENESAINEQLLGETSSFLYNITLGIGIIVVTVVGVILGIKYITGSVEEKAEYKETLVIYLVGCIVLFGAYGIWKIAIGIFK